MSKIVNEKGKIIMDAPDIYPQGIFENYLKKEHIAYCIYDDPFEFLKNVWEGSDLCVMSLKQFLNEFPELGKMNCNDDNKLLVLYNICYTKHIPAKYINSSNNESCKFFSKLLQDITGEQLYITITDEEE